MGSAHVHQERPSARAEPVAHQGHNGKPRARGSEGFVKKVRGAVAAKEKGQTLRPSGIDDEGR